MTDYNTDYSKCCMDMLINREYTQLTSTSTIITGLNKEHQRFVLKINPYDNLDIKIIRAEVGACIQDKIHHLIIMYVAHTARKGINRNTRELIKSTGFIKCELINEMTVRLNILKHKYQPTFKIVDKSELHPVLIEDCPFILIDDPVVIYLGLSKGDVLRIIRTMSGVKYPTYRVVT